MERLVTGLVIIFTISCCEKPADRFSDINGKKLHLLERGEGSPVVVFMTGQNCPLEHFYTVQSQVSKETKTFSYDRSGLGLSEIQDSVRTLDHVAHELNTLLMHEDIQPPYILVGHSLGGLIAREYYHQFPGKVAGFVFVDVANYDMLTDSLVLKKIIPANDFGPDSLATKGEAFEMSYTRQNVYWFKDQGDFKTDLPVHLLIATNRKAGSAELISTKVNTFKLFKRGVPQAKIIYATQSGHHIQKDQPELVTQSIKEVLDEVRNKKSDQKD